jgi:hypothetical protein
MGQYLLEGEMAIMGGTGEFAMARGIIKYKTVVNTRRESYKELDIHALYVPRTVSIPFSYYKRIYQVIRQHIPR